MIYGFLIWFRDLWFYEIWFHGPCHRRAQTIPKLSPRGIIDVDMFGSLLAHKLVPGKLTVHHLHKDHPPRKHPSIENFQMPSRSPWHHLQASGLLWCWFELSQPKNRPLDRQDPGNRLGDLTISLAWHSFQRKICLHEASQQASILHLAWNKGHEAVESHPLRTLRRKAATEDCGSVESNRLKDLPSRTPNIPIHCHLRQSLYNSCWVFPDGILRVFNRCCKRSSLRIIKIFERRKIFAWKETFLFSTSTSISIAWKQAAKVFRSFRIRAGYLPYELTFCAEMDITPVIPEDVPELPGVLSRPNTWN